MAEDLDLAGGIVQVDEHAAVAVGADTPRDAHSVLGLGAGRQGGIALFQRRGLVGPLEADRIGLDPHATQRFQLAEPHLAKRIFVVPDVRRWCVAAILGAHGPAAPLSAVVPAKAATHDPLRDAEKWVPAFAGTTVWSHTDMGKTAETL